MGNHSSHKRLGMEENDAVSHQLRYLTHGGVVRKRMSWWRTRIVDPSDWVSMLDPDNPRITIIEHLKPFISSAGRLWLMGFRDADGLSRLIDTVLKSKDKELIIACLDCIITFLGTDVGIETVLEDMVSIVGLVRVFHMDDLMVKQRTLKALSVVCLLGETFLVLDAFEAFRDMSNVSSHYMKCVVYAFRMGTEDLQRSLLLFINSCICFMDDLNDRTTIRNVFINAGVHEELYALEMSSRTPLDVFEQIDIFKKLEADDLNNIHVSVQDESNLEHLVKLLVMQCKDQNRERTVECIIDGLIKIVDDAKSLGRIEQLIAKVVRGETEEEKVGLVDRGVQCAMKEIVKEEKIVDNYITPKKKTPPAPPPPPSVPMPMAPPPPTPLPPKQPSSNNVSNNFKDHSGPIEKLKPFFWKKLHSNQIGGTIWEKVVNCDVSIDLSAFERLFAQSRSPKKPKANGFHKSPVRSIRLIDDKRSYNIELCIARFKIRLCDIREAIETFDEDLLGTEELEILSRCIPTQEEIKVVQSYKGDIGLLGTTEQFFLALSGIYKLEDRLNAWRFKQEYFHRLNGVKLQLDIVERAFEQVKSANGIEIVLSVILRLGNYMNYDTKRGNAQGFHLSSLCLLNGVKQSDRKGTLMEYVVEHCGKHGGGKWMEILKDVTLASRIDSKELEEEVKRIEFCLNELRTFVSSESKLFGNVFCSIMDSFEQSARVVYREVDRKLLRCLKTNEVVQSYFGLKNVEPWEYFFRIIEDFVDSWESAKEKLVRKGMLGLRKDRLRMSREKVDRQSVRTRSFDSSKVIQLVKDRRMGSLLK